MDSQHWRIHVKKSLVELVHLYFPDTAQHVLFIFLRWFVRREVSGRIILVLQNVAFRICPKQDVELLRNSRLVFFCKHFVRIQEVLPCSSTYTATGWKKYPFILSERSDFHMIDNQSIAVYTLPMRMLTFLSVDVISLSR